MSKYFLSYLVRFLFSIFIATDYKK